MNVPGWNTVDAAADDAQSAAQRAGVTVREIRDLAGEAAVSELFDRVWGTIGQPVMPANLLHALLYAGGYLSGAFADDRLVGGAFGFLGRDEDELYLHSHMTGVDPEVQRSGIGYALKLHQRAWALRHRLRRVEWTFDPLIRHNSYFNLVKLGAVIVAYRPNFYGDMADVINAGDESDRVVVSWDLASLRVRTACAQGLGEPDLDRLQESGAKVVLDYEDERQPVQSVVDAPVLLCHIPEDVVALRRRDPAAARRWRYALRTTFGEAIQQGHQATAITRSGWYVLERQGIS